MSEHWTDGCILCSEIRSFENILDIRAQALTEKVKAFKRPAVERNNKKWRVFARLCRIPVIGDIIFEIFKIPPFLENTPSHYNEEWYCKEGRAIEKEAYKLEEMKSGHLEHWGDEIVAPMNGLDPAGYYTPSRASRISCYIHGFSAFPPEKFDFRSAAGLGKFQADELVLCSRTKRLVPKSTCDFTIGDDTGWKPVYWLRDFSFYNPSVPGFDEWRDDNFYQGKHPRELDPV